MPPAISSVITDLPQSKPFHLVEISRIQSGYLSRQGVRSNPSGTHWLLQAKDVDPERGVLLDGAVRFKPQRNPELYSVTKGDILIAARGSDHRPCLVDVELANTLASNVFYIIRPHEGHVLPEYLAWWLSLRSVQARIDAGSHGTAIGYISRQVVEELSVVVPPREVQRRVANVIELWHRKQDLQTRLDHKREQLIQAACRSAATGTTR